MNKKEIIAAINKLELKGVTIAENTETGVDELKLILNSGKTAVALAEAKTAAEKSEAIAKKAQEELGESEANVAELSTALDAAEKAAGPKLNIVSVNNKRHRVLCDVQVYDKETDTTRTVTVKEIMKDEKLAADLVKRGSGAVVEESKLLKAEAKREAQRVEREKNANKDA